MPKPSRFAELEVAPSHIPIKNPRKILKHEEQAAYLYEYSRESSSIRKAVLALKKYDDHLGSQPAKAAAEKALTLSEIKKAIVYCVVETSFPCPWKELPIEKRQQLSTSLPHVVLMNTRNYFHIPSSAKSAQ